MMPSNTWNIRVWLCVCLNYMILNSWYGLNSTGNNMQYMHDYNKTKQNTTKTNFGLLHCHGQFHNKFLLIVFPFQSQSLIVLTVFLSFLVTRSGYVCQSFYSSCWLLLLLTVLLVFLIFLIFVLWQKYT